MKRIYLLILLCFFSVLVWAQGPQPAATARFNGVVIDSTDNKPMGFVTVSLTDTSGKL